MHIMDSRPSTVDPGTATDLEALHAKLDRIGRQVAMVAERQAKQAELFEEMQPILRLAMRSGAKRLAALEERGYFAFGRELSNLLDRVVTGYSPDDVKELGENVVTILDTVRNLTQPDVLELTNEAAESLHGGGSGPVGVLDMLKASRDDDVQLGMSVLLDLVRRVGRTSAARSRDKKDSRIRRMNKRLAPSGKMADRGGARRAPPPAAARQARPTAKAEKGPSCAQPSDVGFVEDWTAETGARTAAELGLSELSERHWELINFARKTYVDTGVSANLRKMSTGGGFGTKEIYSLFPKAPGRTIARIAGIPKPAGCI